MFRKIDCVHVNLMDRWILGDAASEYEGGHLRAPGRGLLGQQAAGVQDQDHLGRGAPAGRGNQAGVFRRQKRELSLPGGHRRAFRGRLQEHAATKGRG
jgi:hypothetical protein